VYYESNNKTDTSLWQLRNREVSWEGSLWQRYEPTDSSEERSDDKIGHAVNRINWYKADGMGELVNELEFVEGHHTLLSPAAGE
jgi:hypothetical protein